MNTVIQKPTRLVPGPLPLHDAKKQADRLEAILANHQRGGGADMTVREMCEAYQRVWGQQIFPNQAEARLASLEAATRVVCDRDHRRKCSVTGQTVKVYCVPLQQAKVFA